MTDTLVEKQKAPMIAIRFVPGPGFEEKRARVEQALQDAGFPIDLGVACSIDFATGEDFTGYVVAHRLESVTFVSEVATLTRDQLEHLRIVTRGEWLDDPHHLPLLALGLIDWKIVPFPPPIHGLKVLVLTPRGDRLLRSIAHTYRDAEVTP